MFCYAQLSNYDATTAYFQSRSHGWRSTVGRTDAEIAEDVLRDKIDILVDLAGHTGNSRLLAFAYQPAPVQISYLGYPNTTGLPAVAYRLTDALADPPGEPVRHTEELVRLPRAFCYAPADHAPPVSPLPAMSSGRVTFGSLNNLAKLNDQVLDLWCAILTGSSFRSTLDLPQYIAGERHRAFSSAASRSGNRPGPVSALFGPWGSG